MLGKRTTAPALVLLLLVAGGAAAAAGDTASLRYAEAPRVDGEALITSPQGALSIERVRGVTPRGGVALVADRAEGTLVSWSREVVVDPMGGDAAYRPATFQNESVSLTNVSLASASSAPVARLYLYQDAPGRAAFAVGPHEVGGGVGALEAPRGFRIGARADPFFVHEAPRGALQFAADAQVPLNATALPAFAGAVEGEVFLVAWGFNLTFDADEGSREFATGEYREDETVVAGRTVRYVRTMAFLHLRLEGARVAVDGAGYEAIFRAEEPTLHLNGSLASARANGRVVFGGEERVVRSEAVRIGGALEARLSTVDRPGDGILPGQRELQIAATVTGAFSEVRVGGAPVGGAPVREVVAVTATAALLAAVVAFWGQLKAQLAALAAPLLNRLGKPEVLEHERRHRIYRAIEGRPGVHLSKLPRLTGVPLSVVQHHVRVLERAGLVRSRNVGRYRVFFPTNGRTRGPAESRAIAILKDPTRKSIAELVSERPGLTQRELCERLEIKQSRLSHHLLVMEENGLVDVEPSRPKEYGPTRTLRRVL